MEKPFYDFGLKRLAEKMGEDFDKLHTKDPLKVKSLYSFWKNPIKWIRNIKKVRLLNRIVNHYYKNGGKEEIEKAQMEILMYGFTTLKDGKVVTIKRKI